MVLKMRKKIMKRSLLQLKKCETVTFGAPIEGGQSALGAGVYYN